ncbi:putative long-chain-fatty-acid--CoA ligase [Helianthus annuus]|nr:4-coumarate--CoA ligase-like 1 [Helianthus annuus]KAJ0488635.1 putative long-chain-fatty-acid--CoA ligase [Helianthus annuus]KAJ0492173.1 putative long-chain-fatty-acid--CoA ligase [Helianthus annuus]KAJ0504466.1 putative long-chain-fatty-acid--CoA ligase [Helianthus annuus]KAJ0674183.1 putative long-chain-fatty-acid--CoA ligase [Helianthus annuus]
MGKTTQTMTKEDDEEIVFRSRYPSVPIPDNLTLPEFVLKDAELYADHVAFVDAATKRSYTYGEVVRDVQRFSKSLRSLGLRTGHVVVVVLPNVIEYAIVALGIMAAGSVFSGANPSSHSSEIKKQVDLAEAKLIVTDDHTYNKVKEVGLPVIIIGEERVNGTIFWSELLEAAERASSTGIQNTVTQNDLCALPFSSGTTGLSKGVMLTHRNIIANLCSTLFSVGPDLIGKVTILGLIPYFHIYGLTGILCATVRNKGKVVVMGRYDLSTVLKALIEHEVTFAPIVPPILLGLVKYPIDEDLEKLKVSAVMTAAAPLAPEIYEEFHRKFPQIEIQEAYGMTEHSCITLTHGDLRKGHHTSKKRSVGHILPNLEVKFVDPDTGRSLPSNTPGEICVRSQCVMKGYYKNEVETAQTIDEHGWLHTGDIGYIDDEGDMFIVDRMKELIKYKGFQVAPAELEGILLGHPSVEDAAVVGLPDKEAGEIPGAHVVISKDAKETEEDIMKYVANSVAQYKKVRVLHFVDKIPKSPSGKIMRRLIKEKMLEDISKSQ